MPKGILLIRKTLLHQPNGFFRERKDKKENICILKKRKTLRRFGWWFYILGRFNLEPKQTAQTAERGHSADLVQVKTT